MASSIILVLIISFYKLFSFKSENNYKLPLFIFSLFFLFYNYYPFLILDLKSSKTYFWSSTNIEMNILNFKIVMVVSFFYLLFLIGYKLSFLLTEKIKTNYKINHVAYKFTIKATLLLLIIYYFLSYTDILIFSLGSYQNNIEISSNGFYSLLKVNIIILFSIILSDVKKLTDYRIILFTILLLLLSFFSSNKDLLLYLFILFFYIYFNQSNFRNLNLLKTFFLLSIFIFIFLPFFSYFRTFRDIDGFYDWFLSQNYSILSDTGGPLLSLKLLTENLVTMEISFIDNLISFLPNNVRKLFDHQDLSIEFSKLVSGKNYYGQGFGFSMVGESFLYFKKNIFLYIFFIISSGFIFNFFIQLISKKLISQKLNLYILCLNSINLSFVITRGTYASLMQASLRFLILLTIIYLIYKFLILFISPKYNLK